jgi:hypothetical protein
LSRDDALPHPPWTAAPVRGRDDRVVRDPLPGETALIAFGVLAAEGHYSIASVIAIAAAGAIVGDNLGDG